MKEFRNMEKTKVVTFSCSETVYVYEQGCGVLPRWPYMTHGSVKEASEYLSRKTGKEVKVKTYGNGR